MSRKRIAPKAAAVDAPARPAESIFEKALAWTVAVFAAVLPLFILPGADSFRLPKEALLRAEAIVILAIVAIAAILNGTKVFATLKLPRAAALVLGGIAAWTLASSLLSTNRALSLQAVEYTASVIVVFLASAAVARTRGVAWLVAPVAFAAAANSVLGIAQATLIWNPYKFVGSLDKKMRTTGFMGNPNDLGSYLMIATLLLVVAAVATRKAQWWGLALLSAAGVIASGALTAMTAFFTAIIVMTILHSRRKLLTTFIVAGALLFVGLAVPSTRARATMLVEAVENRDFPALTSQRVYSIGTAWNIFLDHPLTGVGPGAFKFNYLPYRKTFDERHPQWYLLRGAAENFAEVHNDHVQILSEEGLPGYLLFVAALAVVASASWRIRQVDRTDSRKRFSRNGGLPLAIGFAVLTLAAFPLELAAPMQAAAIGAAAVIRWSDDAA